LTDDRSCDNGESKVGPVSYRLEAIVGSAATLQGILEHRAVIPAVLVPLRQGIALVPMTDDLFDAVTDGTSDSPLGFWKLPGGFDRVLADWSTSGPIGYVEADYFGGVGGQRAALWVDGQLTLGPLSVDEGQQWPAEGSPISQVLARLGVDRTGHPDEFDAAGLAENRDTEDWLP
jgi:hypothetical protein